MKYTNDDLGVSFSLPDKLTVRQQLAFAMSWNTDDYVSALDAGKSHITEWECDSIPDIQTADIDALYEMGQTKIIMWVITSILRHMQGLGNVPKN